MLQVNAKQATIIPILYLTTYSVVTTKTLVEFSYKKLVNTSSEFHCGSMALNQTSLTFSKFGRTRTYSRMYVVVIESERNSKKISSEGGRHLSLTMVADSNSM